MKKCALFASIFFIHSLIPRTNSCPCNQRECYFAGDIRLLNPIRRVKEPFSGHSQSFEKIQEFQAESKHSLIVDIAVSIKGRLLKTCLTHVFKMFNFVNIEGQFLPNILIAYNESSLTIDWRPEEHDSIIEHRIPPVLRKQMLSVISKVP